MTTTVTINAHCSPDKEVRVKLYDDVRMKVEKNEVLLDGESRSYYTYDDYVIVVKEAHRSKG